MRAILGAAAAAMMLFGGGSAVAQTIGATLDAGDPQATFPRFSNGLANCQTTASGPRYYELGTLTVSATGNYAFTDDSGVIDGILGIYSGAFNPADPAQNCVIGIDDGGGSHNGSGVTLNAGTYTVLFTSYGDNVLGMAGFSYTGPGTLTVGPYAAPAAVPTMSEWAMILLTLGMAGGAAAMVQRRRAA